MPLLTLSKASANHHPVRLAQYDTFPSSSTGWQYRYDFRRTRYVPKPGTATIWGVFGAIGDKGMPRMYIRAYPLVPLALLLREHLLEQALAGVTAPAPLLVRAVLVRQKVVRQHQKVVDHHRARARHLRGFHLQHVLQLGHLRVPLSPGYEVGENKGVVSSILDRQRARFTLFSLADFTFLVDALSGRGEERIAGNMGTGVCVYTADGCL